MSSLHTPQLAIRFGERLQLRIALRDLRRQCLRLLRQLCTLLPQCCCLGLAAVGCLGAQLQVTNLCCRREGWRGTSTIRVACKAVPQSSLQAGRC